MKHLCTGIQRRGAQRNKLLLFLVGYLRIYVTLWIFQPYCDLEAEDNNIWNHSSENQTQIPCSASQELNHYTTPSLLPSPVPKITLEETNGKNKSPCRLCHIGHGFLKFSLILYNSKRFARKFCNFIIHNYILLSLLVLSLHTYKIPTFHFYHMG